MHPTSHFRRRWLLICRVAVTATIVIGLLDGCAASASGPKVPSSSAGAVPRGAASHLAKPTPARQAATPGPLDGPVTVVAGNQVINGVQLGFPHTTVGAISAAADLVSEVFTLDPGRAALVGRLIADSSNPTMPQDAAGGAKNIREYLGIPAAGPVPPGYLEHLNAVEYQLRDITSDQVMVILLCEVTLARPKTGASVNIGVYPFLMHWQHDDWKDAGYTDPTYVKLTAAPYSLQAAALGWKPLRH